MVIFCTEHETGDCVSMTDGEFVDFMDAQGETPQYISNAIATIKNGGSVVGHWLNSRFEFFTC